jgi:hypothetical protein
LNNYNGTPKGHLNRDLRATLPIDQLKGKPHFPFYTIAQFTPLKISIRSADETSTKLPVTV